MPGNKASCVYRKNTFFGTYRCAEVDGDTLVIVDYNGGTDATRAEGFDIAAVAEALLTAMVAREAVAQGRVFVGKPKPRLKRCSAVVLVEDSLAW